MDLNLDPQELNKRIGYQIEFARIKQRKTVKEMASVLDLTQSAYRNIERGITTLSIINLFKIARALDINPSILIDLNEFVNHNLFPQLNGQMEAHYQARIQQYEDESHILKRQLTLIESLILKTQR